MAREPDGGPRYAFATSEDAGTVTAIDLATRAAVATLPTGAVAHALTLTRDGTRLYVVNRRGGSLTVIDPSALAVLDTIGVARAVVVGLSLGARRALQLAARHPQRVSGVVAIDTTMPRSPRPDFDVPKSAYAGWDKDNRHYWLADYRGWLEFFFSQVFTDPHSTKHIEDGVG